MTPCVCGVSGKITPGSTPSWRAVRTRSRCGSFSTASACSRASFRHARSPPRRPTAGCAICSARAGRRTGNTIHGDMPPSGFRFGSFVVDRTGYRALRDNVPLDLTPKLLDLLIFLADHAGSLVTKEQLLDALWPDANVTDNALAQAVSELREALGDHADKPQYIKTIA